MGKHTPGPWRLSTSGPLEICTLYCMPTQPTEDGKGQRWAGIVADNGQWGGPADENEQAANAALIAASPLLLDEARENLKALENILTYLRRHESELSPTSFASLEVRIGKTRTAIATATGED